MFLSHWSSCNYNLFGAICYFVFDSIVFMGGGSGKRAIEGRIMINMSQIWATANTSYSDGDNSYSMVSCARPEIAPMCQDIKAQGAKGPIIHSTQKNYCVYTRLLLGDYYCINNKGFIKKTSVYPGGTGYCDGRTFVCPPER